MQEKLKDAEQRLETLRPLIKVMRELGEWKRKEREIRKAVDNAH